MPASLRVRGSRGTPSSKPYDRQSLDAGSTPLEDPLVHSYLSQHLPPAPPIQDPETPPNRPGLPTYAEYKRIEAEYLQSLSPRKRDKALITQAMFDKIWDVLHQPEACTIETPQFRFWVRKMFSLSQPMYVGHDGWAGTGTYPDPVSDSETEDVDLECERAVAGIDANTSAELVSAVVLHENRPVAIMEQLYELFCYCHVRAGHGGRDKTCAVIRQHYSWVPKELTAQFVKACPTCALKRSGHGSGMGTGTDVGMLGQGRAGRRERRTRMVLGTAEMFVSPVPSSPGSMGWPPTGGPLDPVNPEPCRGRKSTRTREPADLPVSSAHASIDASASGSRVRSVTSDVHLENCFPGGWGGVPRADTSLLHLGDATNLAVVGTADFPRPFAVHENNGTRTRGDRGEKCSSTRTGLPFLAGALSNESLDLDEDVDLMEPGPKTAGECLPPALRPLRPSCPILFDTESDSPESCLFQIDPILLSFNYPGFDLSDSGSASSGGTWPTIPLALSSTASRALSPDVLARRYPLDCIDVESLRVTVCPVSPGTLDPSSDAGEGEGGERHCEGVARASSPCGTALERSGSCRAHRCGSPRYGHRDGPLAVLYHRCSADGAGQDLHGTQTLSTMADA